MISHKFIDWWLHYRTVILSNLSELSLGLHRILLFQSRMLLGICWGLIGMWFLGLDIDLFMETRKRPGETRRNDQDRENIPAFVCDDKKSHCGYEGRDVRYHYEPKTSYQRDSRKKESTDLQHYTKTVKARKVDRWVFLNSFFFFSPKRGGNEMFMTLDKCTCDSIETWCQLSKYVCPSVWYWAFWLISYWYLKVWKRICMNGSWQTRSRQVRERISNQVILFFMI